MQQEVDKDTYSDFMSLKAIFPLLKYGPKTFQDIVSRCPELEMELLYRNLSFYGFTYYDGELYAPEAYKVSDGHFDRLVKRLEALEKTYGKAERWSDRSPTTVAEGYKSHKHPLVMMKLTVTDCNKPVDYFMSSSNKVDYLFTRYSAYEKEDWDLLHEKKQGVKNEKR